MRNSPSVHFELIFRVDDAGPAAPAGAASSGARGRPDPVAVQCVRDWLARQRIDSHDAGFSVAARATEAVFKRHFRTRDDPRVPSALRPWIEAVVLPPAPEMF